MKRTYALLIAPLIATALIGCARDDADTTADIDRTGTEPVTATDTDTTVSAQMREDPALATDQRYQDQQSVAGRQDTMAGQQPIGGTGQTGTGQTGTAQTGTTGQTGMAQTGAAGQQHQASGRITAIDANQNQVTVAHEPVPELDWPAMTMDFEVQNADSLRELEVGDNVEFSFAADGERYVIHDIDES